MQQLHCTSAHVAWVDLQSHPQSVYSPPISPEKRLKVLGILTDGFTSINTPRTVWMYTWSNPALFSGESSSVNKHYALSTSP